MKGLILCGGKGTRLRPFTYASAKHLMPVANKPVLFYAIEALKEAGIYQIAIVVGDMEKAIKEKVGDGSNWGVKISYVLQEKPLGIAHGIKVAGEYLGDRPFVAILGDNIINHPIRDLIDYFTRSGADCTIMLSPVDCPERYGIAQVEGDRVVGLVEKPRIPPSNYGVVGVYIANNKLLSAIDSIEPSERGELEITDAIMQMINEGQKVNYLLCSKWWKDVGKPEDLLDANMKALMDLEGYIKGNIEANSLLMGQVAVEEGAYIGNSIVRGPAIIGKGVVVRDSFIGPYTSIGNKSKVIGCEVENSVILEDCVLENISYRIDTSIIGSGSIVARKDLPGGITLWVPQQSRIEIK